jgi:ParB-like chromosome segregation protein Spo0J
LEEIMGKPEKYQLLPELLPEQFEALKADIAKRGVMVPVLLDEYGAIIDGHNRARACRELGINDYPVEIRSGLAEPEKRALARNLNALRRHLTRDRGLTRTGFTASTPAGRVDRPTSRHCDFYRRAAR